MKTNKLKPGKTGKNFKSEQLEEALRYAEDIFESLPCDFFLLNGLARFIFENEPDQSLGKLSIISLGVKQAWLTPEVVNTLKTIEPNLVELVGEYQFDYHEVPIRITIVTHNYKFFQNLDFRFHKASEYKIANPFNKYWQTRYLIK